MDVLVLVRHPAAFAASLSRLDWRFDFTNFLSQPSLMSTDLAPFADEIEAAAQRPPDPISEAALLWKSIYATVDRYRRERPRWMFLRHAVIGVRRVHPLVKCLESLISRYGPTRSCSTATLGFTPASAGSAWFLRRRASRVARAPR